MRYTKVHYKFQIRPVKMYVLYNDAHTLSLYLSVCDSSMFSMQHWGIVVVGRIEFFRFVTFGLVKIMAEYVLFKQIFLFCFFFSVHWHFFGDFYYLQKHSETTTTTTLFATVKNKGKVENVLSLSWWKCQNIRIPSNRPNERPTNNISFRFL